MNTLRASWLVSGLILLSGPPAALADDPPALVAPLDLMQDEARPGPAPIEGPRHEAFAPPATAPSEARAPMPPPAPIAERPGADRPGPDARWVKGYWAWDDARSKYVWAEGTWVVPPEGRPWVDGRWSRDDRGWYRVPGSWGSGGAPRADWRKQGPPADHPQEVAGEAPGADYFFVAGRYVPEGDALVWKRGFWAKAQPGWDWTPAHWVRRADAWAYREGRWEKASSDPNAPALPPVGDSPFRARTLVSQPTGAADIVDRRTVARPVLDLPEAPAEVRPDPEEKPSTTPRPALVPNNAPPEAPPAEANPGGRRNGPRDNGRNPRRGPLGPILRGLLGNRRNR